MKWKPDWPQAKENFIKWWNHEGPALLVTAPRREPIEPVPAPPEAPDVVAGWIDPDIRCPQAEHQMANTLFAGEAFPYFDTQIGPGSLGTLLGSEPNLVPGTVWYEPCIPDPDHYGPIRFEPEGNKWFGVHMALIEEGVRRANGRYLVGIPDLIENIDTLAAMRGNEELLYDLIERPAWVRRCVDEINEAYFAAFDLMFERVRDEDGGNAFSAFGVWGPGRTAKVQCDFSCMISPEMFREFVVPGLAAQCEWLDYSVYHLDGTTATQHLDALLEIESLNAIQWTPQAGRPGSGSPQWYDLYKTVLAGGKSVHVGAGHDEVLPLLDALGPKGVYIRTGAPDEDAARKLVETARQYR